MTDLKSEYNPVNSLFSIDNKYMNQVATKEFINLMGDGFFSNPKPTEFIKKLLQYSTLEDSIIIDFFAGSGTTADAVMQLNAEDGGNRTSIMVTNNEISYLEENRLKEKGYKKGDPEWEKLGIAQSVTWPRTKCSIEGVDVKNHPITWFSFS